MRSHEVPTSLGVWQTDGAADESTDDLSPEERQDHTKWARNEALRRAGVYMGVLARSFACVVGLCHLIPLIEIPAMFEDFVRRWGIILYADAMGLCSGRRSLGFFV